MSEKKLTRLTPAQALRRLTAIVFLKNENAGYADDREILQTMAFCNLIARYLDKDENLEDDFLKKQFRRINIDLILED